MLPFNREFLSVSLISAFLLFSIGCGDEGVGGIDLAPQIFVFEVESDIVEPGSQIPITIEVADLEGDPISFQWSATGGTINGDSTGALWTAPEQERKYQIELSVSDGRKSTTSTIDIQVWRTRPGNYYPLAVGNTWTYRDDEVSLLETELSSRLLIRYKYTCRRTAWSRVLYLRNLALTRTWKTSEIIPTSGRASIRMEWLSESFNTHRILHLAPTGQCCSCRFCRYTTFP